MPLFTSGGLVLGLASSGLGSRSWPRYFGLGVKNLVLFTSLATTPMTLLKKIWTGESEDDEV